MVFEEKIHICFYLTKKKKKSFQWLKKIRSILIFEKDFFLWRGSHSQNNFMLHGPNKTNNNPNNT